MGDIVSDDKVLVVRRIRVTYRLRAGADHQKEAERVHAVHAEYCPVARTIRTCVEISTTLELVDE